MKLKERLETIVGVASWPPGILDEYSEDEVRAVVDSGVAGEFEAVFRAWLHDKDRARAQRALDAAERSARASERAARFAMWAAIISLVSIVVALALK